MSTKEMVALSVRSEDYNSNNDWGFGGKAGKMYYFKDPGLRMFVGKFYYRHAPAEKVDLYYFEGRSIEKEEFLEILNK